MSQGKGSGLCFDPAKGGKAQLPKKDLLIKRYLNKCSPAPHGWVVVLSSLQVVATRRPWPLKSRVQTSSPGRTAGWLREKIPKNRKRRRSDVRSKRQRFVIEAVRSAQARKWAQNAWSPPLAEVQPRPL
jgi:hypothetical protein